MLQHSRKPLYILLRRIAVDGKPKTLTPLIVQNTCGFKRGLKPFCILRTHDQCRTARARFWRHKRLVSDLLNQKIKRRIYRVTYPL